MSSDRKAKDIFEAFWKHASSPAQRRAASEFLDGLKDIENMNKHFVDWAAPQGKRSKQVESLLFGGSQPRAKLLEPVTDMIEANQAKISKAKVEKNLSDLIRPAFRTADDIIINDWMHSASQGTAIRKFNHIPSFSTTFNAIDALGEGGSVFVFNPSESARWMRPNYYARSLAAVGLVDLSVGLPQPGGNSAWGGVDNLKAQLGQQARKYNVMNAVLDAQIRAPTATAPGLYKPGAALDIVKKLDDPALLARPPGKGGVVTEVPAGKASRVVAKTAGKKLLGALPFVGLGIDAMRVAEEVRQGDVRGTAWAVTDMAVTNLFWPAAAVDILFAVTGIATGINPEGEGVVDYALGEIFGEGVE